MVCFCLFATCDRKSHELSMLPAAAFLHNNCCITQISSTPSTRNALKAWFSRASQCKRKRPPTSDEFLALAVKRQKSLSKQLVVYNAKLAEIKLDIELMEVAKDMLLLKAKADAMKGAMAQ